MNETSREQRLNEAFVKVADTLIDDYDIIDLLDTLVQECTALLDTQAGGLFLVDTNGDLQLMASTSEASDFVEIMQLDSGAGPCVECFTTGKAISISDISAHSDRWPEFAAAALEKGFKSVYATPMRLRGQIIGAMNLFGTASVELNVRDQAVAQALADVATIGILQERSIRETGVAAEQLQGALSSRIIIEQAKGVLAAGGTLSIEEAFATMRQYARGHNLTLRVVAEGITNRTLTLEAMRAQ